jgi:hypothetical protein
VGSYAITPSAAVFGTGSASNYAITYAYGSLTVSQRPLHVTATADNRVYDGDTDATAHLSDDRISGDVFSVTCVSATFANKNVGNANTVTVSGIVIGSGPQAGNYSLANTTTTATANITSHSLDISAVSDTKTYDRTTDSTPSPSVVGLQGSDTVTGLTQAFVSRNAMGPNGSILTIVPGYTVNDGHGGFNYTVALHAAMGTINSRPLTVTATADNKTYDGSTAATVHLSDNRVAGDVFTDSYTSATFADKNVGSAKSVSLTGISISGTDAGNYTVNSTASTSANITARPLTVTAAPASKVADGTTNSGTPPTVTGGIAGSDVPAFVQTYATPAAGTGKTLTPSGIVNDGNGGGNYTYTFVPAAVGTILPAAPTKLIFGQQPTSTGANLAINASTPPGITVQVTDAYNNVITTDNATKVTLSIGTNPGSGVLSCSPATVTVASGVGAFGNCWIDEVAAGYQLQATDTTGTAGHPYTSVLSSLFDITPSAMQTDLVATDPDMKNAIDGFDVLFGKGSSQTLLKLKNTNPGTFHYQLTLKNETGLYLHAKNVALNAKNGASASVILTVPGLPTNMGPGITAPSGVAVDPNPAFVMRGAHPIHVRPDDQAPDIDAVIEYATSAPGGNCVAASGITWITGQPADGAIVRCVRVSDFAIPKHGKAKIDINYELRWKNSDLWSSASQTSFRAGFAFKSQTALTFDSAPNFAFASLAGSTLMGNQSVGLVGAGQKVTAVGGFVFGADGNGIQGATVKLFNSSSGASCSAAPVAQDITTADGFYFIWDAGTDQTLTSNSLPSGAQYYVRICAPSGSTIPDANWPARSMDHKLGNKEFDEEDFYVSPSAKLQFIQQPGNTKVSNAIGTVKVAIVDTWGVVVTGDNATTVTLNIGNNPGGGTLTGTTTVTVVSGVATFTGLHITAAGTGYTLTATSNPFLTGATSNSFNMSP